MSTASEPSPVWLLNEHYLYAKLADDFWSADLLGDISKQVKLFGVAPALHRAASNLFHHCRCCRRYPKYRGSCSGLWMCCHMLWNLNYPNPERQTAGKRGCKAADVIKMISDTYEYLLISPFNPPATFIIPFRLELYTTYSLTLREYTYIQIYFLYVQGTCIHV